jgi:hypothetical protein
MWSSTPVAVSVAAEALARSEGEFLDVTDEWSGRYLVVFGTETDRHVISDATGMRSAFYALDGPFVLASHARLVAWVTGAGRSQVFGAYRAIVQARPEPTPLIRLYHAIVARRSRRPVMSMPGRSTPWSGIVYVTANMILDVETRRLRRAFPRRPLRPLTCEAAAALIAPRLQGQVAALVSTGRPIVISLTGGLDSRVSAAASRSVHGAVRYFTYRRGDVPRDAGDVTTASSICATLGLRYGVIEVGPSAEPPELDAAIREATFLSHGRRIVAAYRAAFAPETIHIRSNVGEIGRCFYRRTSAGAAMTASPRDIPARDLARLWANREVSEPLVESFAEWVEATSFRDVADLDALDLFYWEHRMSCWHSNLVLESDFAFDTHVLFNSRWILERMLSLPVDDRCRGSLFRRLVTEMWPDLAAWPLGAKRTWRTVLVSLQRRMRTSRTSAGGH